MEERNAYQTVLVKPSFQRGRNSQQHKTSYYFERGGGDSDELRPLLSSRRFGNVGKRQIMVEILGTHEPNPLMNGPFDSQENPSEAMVR